MGDGRRPRHGLYSILQAALRREPRAGSTERSGRLKKSITLLLLLALAVTVLVLAGCGDSANTVEDQGRKITVGEQEDGENDKVTVEGEQGEATIEVEDTEYTEETLGVPVYPGAELVPDSGVNARTTSGEKENTFIGAEFTTADAMAGVVDWYVTILGEATEVVPQETTWLFQDGEGYLYLVVVEAGEAGTKITINKMGGNLDIDL